MASLARARSPSPPPARRPRTSSSWPQPANGRRGRRTETSALPQGGASLEGAGMRQLIVLPLLATAIAEPPSYECRLSKDSPVVDGDLSDEAWKNAAWT